MKNQRQKALLSPTAQDESTLFMLSQQKRPKIMSTLHAMNLKNKQHFS
jgi:hypothetical protein